ncbi:MAG TPA: hemolysin III family protein [Nocardioides sp.]|uniref:PAQR family membrane homeostasis protein TrhA n=1 Tax=Nocardioides sp. TaxID=35761 RepID=UPI002B9A7C82|nr:hemolysin III family protein [Nocardioides sp.]HQR26107.1 hemolysin III family protein [Nocardioides sp.]
MNDLLRGRVEDLHEQLDGVLAEVKPRLRGWLHAATAPLTLAAGIVLIALSPDAPTRTGSAIYAASALLLFTVSAVYHRGHWSPRVHRFLARFDHANIFLLIAGSYTPFSLLLLHGRDRVVMLTVVWVGAAVGGLFRIFWITAPRWLYTAIYIALGWAAVAYLGEFAAGARQLGVGVGTAVLVLVLVGGALYTLGGVVYGFRRPDPWPRWFGFHEVFHSFTILAFVTHYVGVSLATYSLR